MIVIDNFKALEIIISIINNQLELEKIENFYFDNTCTKPFNCFFTVNLNENKINAKELIPENLEKSSYDYSISKNIMQHISLN